MTFINEYSFIHKYIRTVPPVEPVSFRVKLESEVAVTGGKW